VQADVGWFFVLETSSLTLNCNITPAFAFAKTSGLRWQHIVK